MHSDIIGSFLLMMVLLTLASCGAPRVENVRLDSADLTAMTDRMAESLLINPAIASRTANDEPWVITLDRVTNDTSDIIPEGEKWAYMARLRALLSRSPALNAHALRFVLPSAHAQSLDEPGRRLTPTHALAATFYTADNYSRQARSAMYLCAFELLDLRSDKIIWEDRYELKRSVTRSEWD
ncbi:MAG: hypothetical protein ACYC26_08340 [Phycisphaerales bacterium]